VLVAEFRDPMFPASIAAQLSAGATIAFGTPWRFWWTSLLVEKRRRRWHRASGQRSVIAAGFLTTLLDAPTLSAALGIPLDRLQPEQLHLLARATSSDRSGQ
jgi:hypothetical protein